MRALAYVTVAAAAAVFVASAVAAPPARSHFPLAPDPATLSAVCGFDVTVVSTGQIDETDFVDQAGRPTRSLLHVVEQDTFSANGKSLTGLRFHFTAEFVFDSAGNVSDVIANGVAEKVPLPDGSLFISAGKIDFNKHPGALLVISADAGNPGNIAAFCAALT